jgi:uncharacterized small protein (DUF1192 family)
MCGSVRDGTIPDRRAPSAAEHCQDCCCARSWKALGVTDSKGLSIPEHIMAMRSEIERERIGARKTFDEFYATIKALRAEVTRLQAELEKPEPMVPLMLVDEISDQWDRLFNTHDRVLPGLSDSQYVECCNLSAAIRAARDGER